MRKLSRSSGFAGRSGVGVRELSRSVGCCPQVHAAGLGNSAGSLEAAGMVLEAWSEERIQIRMKRNQQQRSLEHVTQRPT